MPKLTYVFLCMVHNNTGGANVVTSQNTRRCENTKPRSVAPFQLRHVKVPHSIRRICSLFQVMLTAAANIRNVSQYLLHNLHERTISKPIKHYMAISFTLVDV